METSTRPLPFHPDFLLGPDVCRFFLPNVLRVAFLMPSDFGLDLHTLQNNPWNWLCLSVNRKGTEEFSLAVCLQRGHHATMYCT